MDRIDLSKIKKSRGKYGSSSSKALSYAELEYLRYNLELRKHKIILFGLGYAGLRIEEFIQARKSWLTWKTLQHRDKKLRVLAINVPDECKDVFCKYSLWRPKIKKGRTAYIIDETIGELFYSYYTEHPDGISEEFKSKKTKSVSRNISTYIVGTKFLELAQEYHFKRFCEESPNTIEENREKSILERPKLSAHALRSSCENMLYYIYGMEIKNTAEMLGHSKEIAIKHYLAKTKANIENSIAMDLLGK